MLLGHFGVAMAAKRVAPGASLGTLVLAAQWVDGVWPLFMLLGLEHAAIEPGITAVTPLNFISYPYTHSLVAGVVWAALLGGGYFALRGDRAAAGWVAALVLSHWVLDVISHRADMPTWPGSPKIGLGLWYSVPATLAVEFALFAFGAWTYARATWPRDRLGSVLLATFVGVLALIYVASVFGPPPPSVRALAWTGIFGWLFVAWGYWIDRHREPRRA
jgi:hypothetical protein